MNYYIDKIKESIEFAWKYKFLWVFGFLMALFSGGSGFNGNSSFRSSNESNNFNSDEYHKFVDDVKDIMQDPTFWVVLAVVVCVTLIISLIGWYLLSVSKGALTLAVNKDKEGKDLSFKSSWKDGQEHALDIMMLDVVSFLINLVVCLPLIAVVVMMIVFFPLFLLFCCLVPFYILYFIGWALVYTVAQRYVVLKEAGPVESIKVGFNVVKEKILHFILAGILGLIPGCVWIFIIMIVVAIPAIIIILLGLGLFFVNPIAGIIVLVLGLLSVGIFGAVINSPYQVFSYTYWTKLVMDWIDEQPESIE